MVEQGQEPQPQRQPSPADLKDTLPQYDGSNSQRPTRSSRSQTPLEMKRRSQTPTLKSEEQSPTEVIDGDISITQEPNKPAKLSRKATQKFTPREPPLFNDYEDSTDEATSKFQVIRDCIYGSKYMGSADHDALGCDCNEEFREQSRTIYHVSAILTSRQATASTMLAAKIPIASIGSQKSSASTMSAAAGRTARTNASRRNNSQKSLLLRLRRKATVFAPTQICTPMISFSNISAKSSMSRRSAGARSSMMRRASSTSTLCH